MSKIIKATLGGQQRTIDVGKFWFVKFYGEVTGNDPINSSSFILTPEKQFAFVVHVVYAGMLTDYKVNNRDVDFTLQDVENWIGASEDDVIAPILESYIKYTVPEENKTESKPGEEMTQAAAN